MRIAWDLHSIFAEGNQLVELPETIGRLKHLETSLAANNGLTTLPAEFGQWSTLLTLDLHQNHLTHLPPKIGGLTKLTLLNLADNQLQDLPSEIGQLSNLSDLYLQNNLLTSVPRELTHLGQLFRLRLEGNPLISSLPPKLEQVSTIQIPIGVYTDAQGIPLSPELVHYEEIAVDYSQFAIIDLAGCAPSETPEFEWPDEGIARAFPNYVLVVSGGQHHYPWVRLELWQQEPPVVPGTWEDVCEVTFQSRSGTIHLIDVYDEVSPGAFALGEANQDYHLRLWCRRQRERLESGEAVRGAEQYVFQFWPSFSKARNA